MATAEQVKSLVKAYIEQDDEKFKTVVLQVAAHEAKLGHDNIARDLKKQADSIGRKKTSVLRMPTRNAMLVMSYPSVDMKELVVSDEISERISRVLTEYRNKNRLAEYGMSNRRKILIEGAPGTGKTMTASVIASELGMPLFTVQVDKMVTKFMGETSARLREIFDNIAENTGVYLFDEFDAIGADRNLDNEVGEMRRILNAFLQFIEQDTSDSIIIAATNNQKILDQALFRRFDDVFHYALPQRKEIRRLFEIKVKNYDSMFKVTENMLDAADGLSQAEIVRACDDAVKESIISGTSVTESEIIGLLNERKDIYCAKEA